MKKIYNPPASLPHFLVPICVLPPISGLWGMAFSVGFAVLFPRAQRNTRHLALNMCLLGELSSLHYESIKRQGL